ncbi:benzoylformate decarboxylase [Pseudorhizobium tarimense]|uniref:Benzoylformate decarboxylase n=1 Tax=Pseudorhizobium tarimense TaxID=1079109 RepID=A0ABV2HBH5_9HYPH|nr:thiamine pyrophosphate-binding protein [Pseudorhizobium tarimense]MCJ8520940.1 thiamine pyrophosphate-binding protein [Pseudorhizobium tarimense]
MTNPVSKQAAGQCVSFEKRWGSDVIADGLRALGYDYLALVPGSSFRGLQDSIVNHLGNRGPTLVMCLHEVQSVFIAQGYARAAGRPMAVALHANVGLLNGAMGIFDAWCDRQPMMVIGGTGPVDAHRRRPWIDWVHTARDQGALVRNFVKWDDLPASAEAAVESLLRADQITRSEPRGPVYLCLDGTLQETELTQPVVIPPVERFKPAEPPGATPKTIDALIAALGRASNPVFLFGRGSRSLHAWGARVALAERTGATVLSGLHAAAVFPTMHPSHILPPVGERPTEAECQLLARADLVISFDWHDLAGFLSARSGGSQTQAPIRARIANVSLDGYLANGWSTDHQALAAVDIPVLADPDEVVSQLLAAIGTDAVPDRRSEGPHWGVAAASRRQQPLGDRPMRVADLSFIVTSALKGIPSTFARLPFGWSPLACDFDHPLSFLGKDAGGTVGSGPGHTVGAALALKDHARMVVGIIGDGDFAIGMQALWTAAHMDVPVLFIVANNRSYFNDEVHQERVAIERDRPVENKWIGQRIDPAVDNAAIARAQGFDAYGPVTDERALIELLPKAIGRVKAGGRVFIDVLVEGGYADRQG